MESFLTELVKSRYSVYSFEREYYKHIGKKKEIEQPEPFKFGFSEAFSETFGMPLKRKKWKD